MTATSTRRPRPLADLGRTAMVALIVSACSPAAADPMSPPEMAPPPPTIAISAPPAVAAGTNVPVTVTLPVPPAPANGVDIRVVLGEGGVGAGICPPALFGQCAGVVGPYDLTAPEPSANGTATLTVPVDATGAVQAVVLRPNAAYLSAPLALDVLDVDTWLAVHASEQLIWWVEGQGWVPWRSWSPALKTQLRQAVTDHLGGITAGTPANLASPTGSAWPESVFTETDARALFLSLVAASVATELTGAVPWSIDDLTDDERSLLLDGSLLFSTLRCDPGLGVLDPLSPLPIGCSPALTLAQSRSVPAHGTEVWSWLVENDLLGADRHETIGRMIDWSRDEMLHFLGSFNAEVTDYYWGSRGGVLATAVMWGTDPVGDHPSFPGYQSGFSHWTAGCHGTNTFFREALRVANVPVEYVTAAGHATPYFPSEGLYMSHGDDPYSLYSRTASYPGTELLIDQATYDAWFGVPATNVNGVGRRVAELAALWLPEAMLEARCEDLAAGLGDADGDVFGFLSRHYTLADLTTLGFWAAADAEIAARGGCAAL